MAPKRKTYQITDITHDEDNNYYLDEKSVVQYIPNFIDKKFQNALIKELIESEEVPWQHGYYEMYGKRIPTPRLLYAMRDDDVDISSSYSVTGSMPWTKNVAKLRDKVEAKTAREYTYAQMNRYRTGNDYIGYHTDSEVQDGDVIASISLGEPRRFQFRHIEYKRLTDMPNYEITLEPGSLIIMNDCAAKYYWKHQLPKMPKVDKERINITFRPQ